MWPFRNREQPYINYPNEGGPPGVALYSTRDFKAWKFENWLVKSAELPDDCPYKDRFWGPEIHKIGGKYYLIFAADNWIKHEFNSAGKWGTAGYTFIGIADKINGPYEHFTYVDGGACDTTLFEDSDGKTYAFIPRGNIDVQEIDLSRIARGFVKLIGQPTRIVTADNSDIGLTAKPEYLEGPWAQKIGDTYFLFFAELYKKDPANPEFQGYWTSVAYADSARDGSVEERSARKSYSPEANWPSSTAPTGGPGSRTAANRPTRRRDCYASIPSKSTPTAKSKCLGRAIDPRIAKDTFSLAAGSET